MYRPWATAFWNCAHIWARGGASISQRGREIIVLLAGGSKRTQKTDIKRAKVLAGLLDGEGGDRE